MYSRPWAWFWTLLIGAGSAVAAYFGVSAAGVSEVWSFVAGAGALALCGGIGALEILTDRSVKQRSEQRTDQRAP